MHSKEIFLNQIEFDIWKLEMHTYTFRQKINISIFLQLQLVVVLVSIFKLFKTYLILKLLSIVDL